MSQVLVFIFFFGLCHVVSQATLCTSRGRFPSDHIEECRGYTTCLAGGGDVFYQYDLACPPGFIYNHFDSQCANATGYHCLPVYNCTTLGNVRNPVSNDCKSYITCIDGLAGIVTPRLVDCPNGTVFSLVENNCVNETSYECSPNVEPPIVFVDAFENATYSGNVTVNSSVRCFVSNVVVFLISLCLLAL